MVVIGVMDSCAFQAELRDTFGQSSGAADSNKLKGEIVHIWTAHSDKCRGDPCFTECVPSHISQRDIDVISALPFLFIHFSIGHGDHRGA